MTVTPTRDAESLLDDSSRDLFRLHKFLRLIDAVITETSSIPSIPSTAFAPAEVTATLSVEENSEGSDPDTATSAPKRTMLSKVETMNAFDLMRTMISRSMTRPMAVVKLARGVCAVVASRSWGRWWRASSNPVGCSCLRDLLEETVEGDGVRGEGLHGGHGDGLVQDRLGDVRIRCGEAHPVAVELDDGDVGDLAHPAHVRIGLQYPLRGAALTAQLIGGAVGDEPAAVDDDEVVDETLDQVELVTGEEDGCTGVGEVFEDLEGAFDGDRVESGEGLVEDEGTGTVDESGRDLDLLLVAQAHGLEVVAGFAIQVELVEELEAALDEPNGG